jgi:hypothetical protein
MRLARFSVDASRSMQGEARVKSSRLARTFSISLKQLMALLLFVIVVLIVGFWAVQRVDMHSRWSSQLEKSLSLRTHLDEAYVLLSSGIFETDNITQRWFISEMKYAYSSLWELMRLDGAHQIQLGKIALMLEDLMDPTKKSYLIGLNSTDRNAIASALHEIGWKVVAAYSNYIKHAHSSNAPFWYFGPSPPDEMILEEAVELAIDVKENSLP